MKRDSLTKGQRSQITGWDADLDCLLSVLSFVSKKLPICPVAGSLEAQKCSF